MASPATTPLDVSEDQVLAFRARRQHLAGDPAPTARDAAAATCGAQAQVLGAVLLGLSQRVAGNPTAGDLTTELHDAPRQLVRTWGQRDTLHIYDPADWPHVVAARAEWSAGGRGGPAPTDAHCRRALTAIDRLGRPVTRTDLIGVAPAAYRAAAGERAAAAGMDPDRFVAGRLIWALSNRGMICHATGGREQSYARRTDWLPDLPWPDDVTSPTASRSSALRLVRRYLAAYGPATAHDVAHFFNARVTVARAWLADLTRELRPVTVRADSVILADDADDLARPAPRRATDWPIRLLPGYDNLLMGHADKSWTTPDETDRPRVWRRAAVVAPAVLARGRIVATWSHAVKRRQLTVTVQPLSGWRERTHAAGVRREAKAVAVHLGAEASSVVVGAS